jgi:serine/threonine-protein kinase
MEDLTGKQLGPYQLVAQLGEGGMAVVYKAYQPSTERYVALKILPRHFAAESDFIRRFKLEAKIIAGLEHPNILPVYDYGEADGYTYIVMRFVEGGKTLADLMQGKPLQLDRICDMLAKLSAALDYAHSRGVVHRDIKPSNVLIDPQGNLLLGDFGLAKMFTSSSKFTLSGAFLGTPTYASPEQCLGRDNLDGRSDVYSLGVMLYEMATGRPPYDADTPMAVVVKHINDPLPLPRKINPDLPESVERVILKALAKDREDRYQTAGEMSKALEAAAVTPKADLAATVPEPVKVDLTPTVAEEPLQVPQPKAPKKRRPSPWVWAGGAMGCLILVGGMAVLAMKVIPSVIAPDKTDTPSFFAILGTVGQVLSPTLTPAVQEPGPVGTMGLPPTSAPANSASDFTDWQVEESFPSPGAGPTGIVRVGDDLWVIVPTSSRIYRLDLKGAIQGEISIPAYAKVGAGMAWDGTSLWSANWGSIYQSNPATGETVKKFDAEVEIVASLAWGEDGLWAIDREGNLIKYDPSGQRLQRLALSLDPSGATGMTWAGRQLWVTDLLGKVTRFGTDFSSLGTFQLKDCIQGGPFYETALFWDGESLWAADPNQNRIYRCIPSN